MRDLVLAAIVFGSVPLIFRRPHIGVLMWIWVGMMNPQTEVYGFMQGVPVAAVTAVATLTALLLSKEKMPFPVTPITVLLVVFFLWMCVTRIFALNTDDAVNEMWGRVFKIHLMLWVTLMLIDGRQRIEQMIWAIVVSIGFYGVKGGVFTALTAGSYRVWGPQGTFIGGNNELSLALVVLIPLMYYLYAISTRRVVRNLLLFSMFSCALAILGSHSRGALIAIVCMSFVLAAKSNYPARTVLVMILIAVLLMAAMPDKWWDRMETINTYQQDTSAMQRVHTWATIWRMALDRPIFGAGFDLANPLIYQLYAENPDATAHAAHSIYFQALGEHGFVGLGLYLTLALVTWITASRNAACAKTRDELGWIALLMRMVQVAIVGFASGGAFLGLLHFDLPYYLIVITVLAKRALDKAEANGTGSHRPFSQSN